VIVKPRSVDLAFEIRGLSSDRALGSEVERRNSTGALSGACHCRSASPTMPRQARVATVGAPHHITRRGNNRQDVFLLDPDRGPCLRASAIACRHPRSPDRQGKRFGHQNPQHRNSTTLYRWPLGIKRKATIDNPPTVLPSAKPQAQPPRSGVGGHRFAIAIAFQHPQRDAAVRTQIRGHGQTKKKTPSASITSPPTDRRPRICRVTLDPEPKEHVPSSGSQFSDTESLCNRNNPPEISLPDKTCHFRPG